MISNIQFDNDSYLLGITADSMKDLVSRRGTSELTKPHRVEFYALILVTEGNGYHYIDNKLYHCRPGTLLVLSPLQIHYFDSLFQWEGYVISFQDSEVFSVDNLSANYAITKAIRSVDIMDDLLDLVGREFNMLYEECHARQDLVSGSLQRNLLQSILYKIFFRNSYRKQEICRSKEFSCFQVFSDEVEKNYSLRHNVSDYTDDLRVSVKRLNTVCKKVKGMSAKQVIDARLILEAKRLIGYTSTPISEIAYSLGFNEPTNLAKFFKRHTDISPTEFRNMSKFFSDKK
ncbi:AraC family transcriptional regulator [Vibrio algarum]|uniref:Helix-turn-helix transcriptional regulator n=1 Tax=Vibrio algarum TaxID=3020714 RepID=A0ABT4YUA8_9VIBR|nr:helix-turn-helix transcriptional regulator [Vibrio sp. KJ40-1]MDB1125172.1 helix-turn-helix transcriptional regulator [Vibrio sp. KJ40-1]